MTADDTVTAKLAEWEADMDRRVPAADPEDRNIARALLGFVREVRAMHASSQDTRGVGQVRDGVWTPYCEEDGENWPCPTEQAARKWIGGAG